MEIIALVRMVRSTLNDVEVKGKDNLDKLLGCINALESIEKVMAAPPAPHEETAQPNTPEQEETNG